jgi:transcriptional regulator with XRE-family HTH domain
MKSVGERIRQARKFRGLSGEELALKVGYKTQSGISNLEHRWSGNGGYRLPAIARELNFSLQWFLEGPDTEDMTTVPAYDSAAAITPNQVISKQAKEPRPSTAFKTPHERAQQLIEQLNELGAVKACEYLEMLVERHPATHHDGAGVYVPARLPKTA